MFKLIVCAVAGGFVGSLLHNYLSIDGVGVSSTFAGVVVGLVVGWIWDRPKRIVIRTYEGSFISVDAQISDDIRRMAKRGYRKTHQQWTGADQDQLTVTYELRDDESGHSLD